MVKLEDISIRNELRPGDLGYVIYLHGILYSQEYGYGLGFENYVAGGLHEFIANFDAQKDVVWVCEHGNKIVGFLSLVNRGQKSAQLRYFLLHPTFRGVGLGKKLIHDFMSQIRKKGYSHIYLWTTQEQQAAASLYTRLGFRLTEEKHSTSFGKPLTEQRYDLFL